MTDTEIRGAFRLVLDITQGLKDEEESDNFFLSMLGKIPTRSQELIDGHKWSLETLAKYKAMVQVYIDAGKPEVDLNMSSEDIAKVYDIMSTYIPPTK